MKASETLNLLKDKVSGHLLRRTPIIIQSETAECGLACLAMVAGHHGYRIDLPAARSRFSTSLKGWTLRELIAVGGAMELATRALQVGLSSLSQLRLPCILHWDHNHFVVLIKVGSRDIIIHDPAAGRRKLPIEEASRHFTGVVLEAWPTDKFERKTERLSISLLSMVTRTVGIKRAALQIILFSTLLELVSLGLPVGFQLVIDQVVVSADADLLKLVCAGLIMLVAIKVFTSFLRSWTTMVVGSSLVLQWKVGLFDHLIRLPLNFFEKRHVGDVVSRFGSLDEIQKTLTGKALTSIMDGIMAVLLIAMMYVYGGWLVVVAVAAVALYASMRWATYTRYRSLSEEAIIHHAKESSHFIESIRGIASMKALNLEPNRRGIWINHLVDRVGAGLRAEKFNIVFTAAAQTFFGLDRVLMIYLGGHAILSGSMSVGMLVAFLAYKDQFAERVNTFVDTAASMRMLSLHGERIADIALSEPEPGSDLAAPAIREFADVRGTIALRNISYRYAPGEPEIIHDLNLDVPAGACIGIAGASGSGKSTLLKVIGGLIRPSSGEIFLDGVSIGSMGYQAFRRHISYVLQEDRLFAGSIAENISCFDRDADPRRIRSCAEITSMHADIMRMPMGYETLVGDMGSSLSGGQVQRIILARALYRRPKILLLDEATSSLDEQNEARINDAISRLRITRVIVAHRPSSLAVADRILSLNPRGTPIHAGRSTA